MRLSLRILLVFVAVQSFTGPAYALARSAPRPAISRMAPADEYFGRLKMSILGIRNQLRDLNQRLSFSPGDGAAILGSASFVEDSIRDWERKYPADPWLAKSVYQLTHLYSRVPSNDGRRDAARGLHWLMTRYRRSSFASLAANEIGSLSLGSGNRP